MADTTPEVENLGKTEEESKTELPVNKNGHLNPKVTRRIGGELGTDAATYKDSGLDEIEETSGLEEEYDEEDDTRLGGV